MKPREIPAIPKPEIKRPKHWGQVVSKPLRQLGVGLFWGVSVVLGQFGASMEAFPPSQDIWRDAGMGITPLEQPRWMGRGSSLMCYQEHHRKSNFHPPLSSEPQRRIHPVGIFKSPSFPWGSAHPHVQVMFEEEQLCSIIAAIVQHRPRQRLIIGL